MTIHLGSDHAGFAAKERTKRWLLAKGHRVVDFGNEKLEPLDDYPDYALPLARAVAKKKARGILFCANGVGVCMVANRVRRIRAGIAWSVHAAKTSRADDNTNILCVPTRIRTIDPPEKIIAAWLQTKFSGAARHKRRLKKVGLLDNIRAT